MIGATPSWWVENAPSTPSWWVNNTDEPRGFLPQSQTHQARRDADRKRGMFLLQVEENSWTLDTALAKLHSSSDRSCLGKIRLTYLLRALGYSDYQARRIRRQVHEVSESRRSTITLSWLLDRKCGLSRLIALYSVLTPASDTPWNGFPFTPPPVELDEVARAYGVIA